MYNTIKLEYDVNDVIKKRVYPNGLEEIISYDGNYNVLSIKTANETLKYEYNGIGQVIKKNEKEFKYDNLDRLIKTSTEEFTYDLAGNELSKNSIYDATQYNLLENERYILSYDKRGNLKEKINKLTNEKSLYLFNTKNQLISYKRYNSNKLQDEYSFKYDAFNRRISKTYNNQTLYYVYDNLSIIGILDKNKELLATITHEEKIDKPLSITVYDNGYKKEESYRKLSLDEQYLMDKKHQKTYYYHRDHQGSIIALSNDSKEIIESFIYDESYGKIISHKKLIETYNPYCYTSREFDSQELYYYRARYYDPTIKTFISKDPIEFLSGDYNFYRYVGNDPVNFVDPLGLAGHGIDKDCMEKTTKNKRATGKIKINPKKVSPNLLSLGKEVLFSVASAFVENAVIEEIESKGAIVLEDQYLGEGSDYDKCVKEKEKSKTAAPKGKEGGTKVKNRKKPRKGCGEKGKHKDAGSETKEERDAKSKSEKMDSDHIPSQEHVKRDIDKKYTDYTLEERDCMKKYVSENMDTIMLPNDIHSGAGGKTAQTQPNSKAYKNWEKDFKSKNNGKSPTLHDIAKRETDIIEKEIDKKGRANDPCGKKIKEGLKDFKNLDKDYFTNLYDKAIENINNCLKNKKK